MQKLTLGSRLGLAFGALIALMCVLGGLAVWRINLAVSLANDVSAKHAPEVLVAHDVVTSAWETRFAVRDYSLTGDADALRRGRKGLVQVGEHLKAADDLAKRHPDLTVLRQGAATAATKTAEFEAVFTEVEAQHLDLGAQELAMEAAAKVLVESCRALRASQEQELHKEIDDKADAVVLKERYAKIMMVEGVTDIGNDIRLGNFKAQAAADLDAMRSVLALFASLDRAIADLAPLVKQQVNVAQLARIREGAEAYRVAMEKVLKGRLAIEEHTKELYDTGATVTDSAGAVADGGLESTDRSAVAVSSGLALTSTILIVGLLVATIAGILIAWLSTRAITVPIREGVNALAATASQVSSTVAQLASNASEAAAAVAETTTTVDEVRQTAQVAADKAKAVADNAQGASRAAQAGRQATEQTAEGLNRIREQMSSIGESITRLSEQSQAVGDIVSTVTDLAEQSNLLAVNASIEAAKAGDMGKGFAVVAQEIRSLAEQSKDSTKQVRGILSEVQRATGKAVMEAEQGGKSVADGSKQAEEAGQAIKILTDTVQDATRAAVQIAASSQQQLVGMEQVGRAMENIKQATTQNAEGARQLSAAAHALQEVGLRLKAMVGAGGGQ